MSSTNSSDQVVYYNGPWDQIARVDTNAYTESTSPPSDSNAEFEPAASISPAPRFDPDTGEVFVCVDVECHCYNQSWKQLQQGIKSNKHRVCEVGITVFDPSAFTKRNLDPGDRHVNAWSHMKTFNIGIKEHEHRKKGSHARWCKRACAEDFLFGETKWVFKNQFKKEFINTVRGAFKQNPKGTSSREIIFLTFGVNDEEWLNGLDLDLYAEFSRCSVMDMQELHPARTLGYRLDKQLVSGSDLFTYLGIPVGNNHNGGNDSRFELQAFLAMWNLTQEQWDKYRQGRPLELLPKSWDDGEDDVEEEISAVVEDFGALQFSEPRIWGW